MFCVVIVVFYLYSLIGVENVRLKQFFYDWSAVAMLLFINQPDASIKIGFYVWHLLNSVHFI